jgi:FKBP-type peptidyl-prolyl cis-trans isomerase FklB
MFLVFARSRTRCDNTCMRKISIISLSLVVGALFGLGNSNAQDTSAPKTPSTTAPAQKPSTTGTTGATATTKPRTGTGTRTAGPLVLKTDKDKISYAIGVNIGTSLHKDKVDVDPAIFLRGLKDALAAGKLAMTDDQMRAALGALQAGLRKKQETEMAVAGDANKKAADAFLAENKSKQGVVVLPSGLQYKIIKEGTGPKPTATDTVECQYRGTLIDGKEFDSSYKRGQAAKFPVNGVIKGWTEALQLMPVGSKWQLYVPGDLAYGNRGAGPDIGPNTLLIFDVELVSIQDKAAAKQPAAQPDGQQQQQ